MFLEFQRIAVCCAVVTMACAQCVWADTNSWNQIRYNGGTIQAKVNPYDWNTTLTVTPDAIVLVFAHRQTVRINPSQVTTLSYGQEAHRRVAEMVALGVMVNPLALFGMLHKGLDHYIGIEYRTEDGKTAAILLQAHKDNYRAILQTLKTATGKPVENAP
jgi:hypothetical protein